MRSLLISTVMLVAILSVRAASTASAASTPVVDPPSQTIFRGESPAAQDDDTVAVQLTVLGIVIGTVFVLGSAAYILRWKLGRTAYTPPKDSAHH